eukprot:jgi/Mesen1/5545/ME000280S04661
MAWLSEQVRHGQGYHNVAGEKDYGAYMSQEYLDASLTPAGWQQTAALKKHIAAVGGLDYDLVVTSPLMRTMQTAVGVFGGGKLQPGDAKTPLMTDRAGGSLVGPISSLGCPPFVATELCREHLVESDEDALWTADHRETKTELAARCARFVQWLLARKEQRIAVVSHSGFLIELLAPYGLDCDGVVGTEIRKGYANCELRSLVLVSRSAKNGPSGSESTFGSRTDFPGGMKAILETKVTSVEESKSAIENGHV